MLKSLRVASVLPIVLSAAVTFADNSADTVSIGTDAPQASSPLDFAGASGDKNALSTEATSVPLEFRGQAKLSVLLWDVYESRLYTPGGEWAPGIRPLKLEIRYLRDVAAEDLVAQTRKEWVAQGIATDQHDQWLKQLSKLWQDVAKDDVIALELDANGATRFRHNGELLGTIEEPQFGEDFSGIWLSAKTTRPELRQALIGGGQ